MSSVLWLTTNYLHDAKGCWQLLTAFTKPSKVKLWKISNMWKRGKWPFLRQSSTSTLPKRAISDVILSYFTIVGISHHHQHSCPCLGADLGLREMFVIKSVRYSSALERTLPSPLTSSTDEEAVADGDNYDIADDEEYYANAGADVYDWGWRHVTTLQRQRTWPASY